MKIKLAILDLLHADGQSDIAKRIGVFFTALSYEYTQKTTENFCQCNRYWLT
jgi:hypothetical protein